MPAPAPQPAEPAKGFVHLHLHSEYSLLDGGNRIDRLIDRVKELGMNAVGVTDHGNLFGAVAFYTAAREAGVKPILGVEAYVTPPGKPRTDRTYSGGGEGGYHLVLLAQTLEGWNNLLVLCSEAYLTGFYYKPRIDRELLAKHAAGLIAINGHLGSEIGDHLLAYERSGDEKYWDLAVESARWHAAAFGSGTVKGKEGASTLPLPRFYIELQHHIPEQNAINKHLIRLARELNLPLVCDNDAHFLKAEDHDAHDTLICISTQTNKAEPDRMHYPTELYVKSPEEMHEVFDPYGEAGVEAMANTLRIADSCSVELPLGKSHAPAVRIGLPDKKSLPTHDDPAFGGDLTAWYQAYCAKFEVKPLGMGEKSEDARKDSEAALRMLSEAGFVWRYGAETESRGDAEAQRKSGEQEAGDSEAASLRHSVTASLSLSRARLERELKILCDKNIAPYFLIVWDFVNWGRQNGVPALARGSGVGTMVGYVLGLSNACPVRYGLLFERFTDPDRTEYPDIDIDLCQDGRGRVIDYVRQKYGHVAQIITFGTMKARAAIRDVARVLGVSLPVADRIAKLIPEQLNITLDEAIEKEPDLKGLYEGKAAAMEKVNKDLHPTQVADPDRIRKLIDNARTLEGQARHASVHAAGVIVATRPLQEIVPLYKQTGSAENEVVTQWDGPTCEKMGLLKMDFLGLRTISIIERAKKLIREGLPEAAIWAGVGRGEEYEKWQSGKVAEWQSEVGGDGGAPGDQDISGSSGVAARDGLGSGGVSGNGKNAQERDVLVDKPDAARGKLHSDERGGRIRQAHSPRVPAGPSDRGGIAGGAHDGVRTGDVTRDDQAVESRTGASGRRGSSASRADSIARNQDPERAKGEPSEVAHFATSIRPPHPLDLDRLTFDDQRIFELFRRGETTGVFQFESPGMRRLLVEMKPDRLEDLIAANALFRPGPMDLIPDYNRRKHGQAEVPKSHPLVDKHTVETYGVMVYQEQVMQIVHELGGIGLRDAYSLIKNISKKRHDKIEKERPKFITGAQSKGLSRAQADELFELILKFAGYGFNKSHSTGYAIVAYQTAYLKTFFPCQYMAAFLTFESQAQKASDWISYLEDCKKTRVIDPLADGGRGKDLRIGVEVKPPDVNLSQADFAVVFEPGEARDAQHGHVRFGLSAIKGAGEKAIGAIIAERDQAKQRGSETAKQGGSNKGGRADPVSLSRSLAVSLSPFTSLLDFCERVLSRGQGIINKAAIESLVVSGTFDSVHGRANRAAMVATIEQAMSAGQKLAADKASGQNALFGFGDSAAAVAKSEPPLAKTPAWSEAETLSKEKGILGFYVSSHPLDAWRNWSAMFATGTTASARTIPQDGRIVLAGLVQSIRIMVAKSGRSAGQKMAGVVIEDLNGVIESICFADGYAQYGHLISPDAIVFVLGRVDHKRGEPQIVIDRIIPIDGVPLQPGRLRINIPARRLNGTADSAIDHTAKILAGCIAQPPAAKSLTPETPGFPLEFVIETERGWAVLAPDPKTRIAPTPKMAEEICKVMGPESVKVVAGVTVEPPRPKWQGNGKSYAGSRGD